LVILDLAVSVFISAALFAFIVGMREPAGRRRRWLFWGFYAAMALAALTKGLIGIALPCAVIFFWVLLLNRWGGLRPFYPFSGSLLLVIIAAPWHVLAAQANHDFLYFYFYHEHYLRFTTKIHGRYEPWWYFLPIVLAGLFPWVAFFFQSLRHTLEGGWRNRARNETAWFLVIWIVFIIAFFSKSQSKLIPYILPVFPAAAVLIGRYLASAWMQPQVVKLTRGLVAYCVIAVTLAVALFFIKLSKDPEMSADLRPWQWAVSSVLGAGAIATAWMGHKRGVRGALGAMAWSTVALLLLLNPVGKHADNRSTKPLALALQAHLQPTDEVFAVAEYFQDLPVYLGRTVNVVDYQGELEFGIHSEPEKTASRFINREAFLRRWQGTTRCFAVAKRRDVESLLSKSDFPHFNLGEFHGLILFANQAP
jgi:4-amino-4-deoxy-L-arabinose transferase-like glycosyltransferase